MHYLKSTSFVLQHDNNPPCIRLGLCCINNTLREKNIFCSRGLIARTYTLEKARKCVTQNLIDLKTILTWNVDNGIQHYRLSSDMFPRITDGKIPKSERLAVSEFKDVLAELGTFAKASNQRITMHPGQYNQIGAVDRNVFERTVEDLGIHTEILDYMGMDDNAILTIHGGGVYGDKENTIRRWIEQFDELDQNVKDRIALENCENCYSIRDVLYISEQFKRRIPVIFDSHHLNCYNIIHRTEYRGEDYIPHVLDSWGERRMVAHISDQREGSRLGSHSDYIETIPDYFLNIPEVYGVGVDIEVEAKKKEDAVMRLVKKYGFKNIL